MIHFQSKTGGYEYLIMAKDEDEAWEMLSEYLASLPGYSKMHSEFKYKSGYNITKPKRDCGINFPKCHIVLTKRGRTLLQGLKVEVYEL